MSRHQLKLLAKRRKQMLDNDAESIASKIASDTYSKVIEKQLFDPQLMLKVILFQISAEYKTGCFICNKGNAGHVICPPSCML
jgi:hypothetical protein